MTTTTAPPIETRDASDDEKYLTILEHLRELLAEKGLTFRHVVKTTVLLSRGEFFWIYTKIYQEYFKKPYPARTTIPCASDTVFLEIDLVAYKKGLSDAQD